MADTAVFRTAQGSQESTVVESSPITGAKDDVRPSSAQGIEVPYLDYENEHGHPLIVDYFKLGDTWADPEGGFPKEVESLKEYIEGLIKNGELANSPSAVKARLKTMEKITRVADEERSLVKIETLAAYVRFLKDTANIRNKLKGRY